MRALLTAANRLRSLGCQWLRLPRLLVATARIVWVCAPAAQTSASECTNKGGEQNVYAERHGRWWARISIIVRTFSSGASRPDVQFGQHPASAVVACGT